MLFYIAMKKKFNPIWPGKCTIWKSPLVRLFFCPKPAHGAHVVSIESAEEQDFIEHLLEKYPGQEKGNGKGYRGRKE